MTEASGTADGNPIKGKAIWTTSAVQNWLTGSRLPKVLAVYRRSCNLLNEHNQILTVAHESIGRGPFTLVVDIDVEHAELVFDFDYWLDVDSPIHLTPENLEIGELTIDITCPENWNPKPPWNKVELSDLNLLLEIVWTELETSEVEDGLISLLKADPENPFDVQARKGWLLLQEGLKVGEEALIRSGSRILAGLGPGLTPAGDDFLMGVMVALWLSLPAIRAEAFSDQIFSGASTRTTILSGAWLEAARQGNAGILWHELVENLNRRYVPGIKGTVTKIIATGHSSGADAMTGLFLATSTLVESGAGHY